MSACVSQYVLKVCGRCDLCYAFEHADQSWRHKLKIIDRKTFAQTASRIAEHARLHRLDQVSVILHDREPLLLGTDQLRDLLHTLRPVIGSVTRLELKIHTNAVR